ncbi:MAG: TIGR03617 family F420-dependent LLM class oxidoreductase [Acidimicrobiia bacterium]
MKVDFYLPPGPIDSAVGLGRRAERLGYGGIFSTDTSHEPFLPLVVVAGETRRLDLGTAIAVAFARSPMTVASAAWDLAAYSKGRLLLGLGTQVRGHITRRFSMPWDSPGPRLREFIAALRAIWDTWQNAAPLRFKGDFYQFTLMTPFFNPGPIREGDIPIYIAGVGEYMCRLSGEVCQGFHIHPLHTVRYLDEVVLPGIREGARVSARSIDDVERVATVFVITGRDEAEMRAAADGVKLQIAFYASTPAYIGVLELHGWDFGPKLTAMSKRGEWAAMADVISDDVVREIAVIAPIDELGSAIRERYGDRVQRIGYYPGGPLSLGDDEWATLIEATKGP